ncbi:hypothetical protein ACHAXA_001832 [Cyclostephanos tholiformis]|uniref:Pseudouridine synthase RsuA/RluA-like domain-containing protein n=1 Tax=Cyclostephanos tholiformis TaxID=382380 RepID=A0ABD3R9R2_9STRA
MANGPQKNAPRFLDYRRSPLPLDVAISFATTTTTRVFYVRDVVGKSPRELVLTGGVRVNGIVETSLRRHVSRDDDCVEVLMMRDDGEMSSSAESSWVEVAISVPRYFACYKPRGVVCAAGRNEGYDRADSVLISEWLEDVASSPPSSYGGGDDDGKIKNKCTRAMKTVGRLDEESEGLILMTDDGSFSRLLCDPEFGLEKTYRVIVRGTNTQGDSMTTAGRCDDEDHNSRRRHLAEMVSDMIHRGQSTGPHFMYESCRVLDVGRLTTQHPSDDSYYALVDLALREGKRHEVRRIIKNATAPVGGGGGGGGRTMRVCYLSRIAVEGLAFSVVKPESLIEAQEMGFLPADGGDGERHRRGVPTGKLVPRNDDESSMLLHRGHMVELSGPDVDRIFSLRSKGYI